MKFKYLDLITATFAVVLILSNITSIKTVSLGSLTFDGGMLLFPLAYIFGDILTEVYGYARARRVIWIGFGMNLLAVLTFALVGYLPTHAESIVGHDAFLGVLGVVPRIVLASLIAYLFGEFLNSYVLAKMKVKSGGKKLWQRAIGSTLVGQLFDTSLFVLIAFAGILPWEVIWVIAYVNYIFKIALEVVLLPITYRIVAVLKKKEGVDFFDKNTDFSPLHVEA